MKILTQALFLIALFAATLHSQCIGTGCPGTGSSAAAVLNNQANAWSLGLQDFSAAKLKPPLITVSALPSASSNPNVVYLVTDGTSASDCTAGGGSSRSWCASNGTSWASIGGSGGATYSAQLLDLKVTRTSGTALAVSVCSPAPCYISSGVNRYSVAGGQTITADGVGSSSGTVWVYALIDGTVHTGTNAPGITCTGCTLDGVITGPPSGSVPLATWSVVAGNFTAAAAVNDTRPILAAQGVASPQAFPRQWGYVTAAGGAVFSGDFYFNGCDGSGPDNGVRNGPGISMPTTGCEIVIHHYLTKSWDGSAPSIVWEWSQANGAPSGAVVRYDVSVACTVSGSSTTLSFGTAGSTTVSVPAFNVLAYSTLSVPTAGCVPESKMSISIKNSPNGTGTTYGGGAFDVWSATLLVTQ